MVEPPRSPRLAEVLDANGTAFLERWIADNVTEQIRKSVDGDAASVSVELVERLIADAAKAGFSLEDLESELGSPETLIREALEMDEGTQGIEG